MEKYIVTLTAEEAEQLQSLVGKGKHVAQKVINALILLNCEQSQGTDHRRTSQEIAQVLQVSERKIDRVKRRFVQDGLELALSGQPSQREYVSKVDGDVEAHLIALSCSAPPRRTKTDWAPFIEGIANSDPQAQRITLVMDSLSTHTPALLYEASAPDKAKALWDRFEFIHTPKHGSWLNMAEIEINVMVRQCLNRRIADIQSVRAEVAARPDQGQDQLAVHH
jgi:hypothetical protein